MKIEKLILPVLGFIFAGIGAALLGYFVPLRSAQFNRGSKLDWLVFILIGAVAFSLGMWLWVRWDN